MSINCQEAPFSQPRKSIKTADALMIQRPSMPHTLVQYYTSCLRNRGTLPVLVFAVRQCLQQGAEIAMVSHGREKQSQQSMTACSSLHMSVPIDLGFRRFECKYKLEAHASQTQPGAR